MSRTRRFQKRIPGHPRDPLPSCVEGLIKQEVEKIARTYGCSRSWVIAQILADALDITMAERYDVSPPRRLRRRET